MEATLWSAFSAGAIKVLIHRTLPMTRAEEAHAILQNEENLGKVVLTLDKE